MDVLVLNYAWRPMRRVSWQLAFQWVFAGRAEVVESYPDRQVRSAHRIWPVPSIVRFFKRVKARLRPRRITFNRRNVWLRDGGRCQYCGHSVPSDAFTYDHIRPRSRGGPTSWENIVVACLPCNQYKADLTPEQAGMRLVRTPARPRKLPARGAAGLQWQTGMPASWRDYMGSVAWWTEALD